jgi:para-nitrobenzyl esterase
MRLRALTTTLALISGMTLAAAGQSDATVSVSEGKLHGSLAANGEAVFKGIPFAQPPVGNLRWRAPLPAKKWTDTRDASSFGPACVQGGAEGKNSSEDCLYLNVWTPTWPMKSPASVMVWIYGGGNFAGAASDPTFDGTSLARHGVVVVTVNYRLGVFGFLAHPELTAESAHHVSGNYGLLDQVLALQWIHNNIARFGGDPRKVTIFGESAGSLDINVLMASPLTEGLFQRVIGESGPVVAPPRLAEGEKKGVDFAAKLGISGNGALTKLRAVSSADLLNATGQGLAFLGPTLGVVVDGWVFPQSPMNTFAAGHEHRVGLMLGSNSQELQKPFFPMPGGGLREAITQQYGALADRALTAYGLNGATDPAPDPELGPVMAQWATDTQFRCGSVAELVWHASAKNPAYQFQFSRSAPGREALGAPHGSEVPYVFGTLGTNSSTQRYNDIDRKLSEQMQEYWTTFAKTGDPNDGAQTKWPKFDPAERGFLDLTDSGPVAKQGLRRTTCDLYTELLKTK